MFQIVRTETFEDKQIIFKEGTFGDWMYIIEEGGVEISRTVGGKKVILANLEEGEIIGEVAYISRNGRSATAIAIGKTKLGTIDRQHFDNEFNELSHEFQAILKTMALRLGRTTEFLMECHEKLNKQSASKNDK
ncbi:MAG: cyclic nucleotide-binding protein [Deltaproteobacteria bacterium HGW-Deltaproteobacteria-6]|jgi:CRP-like cAMP-binding protein|nr:MAG: cyclic nucleotide-binding protein [Deltaproteobacteria bacterium HGW-Deltaproteobacteria-6]